MAERFISPGIFTQENDLSFLPQGLGDIGATVVGRTSKGPAFKPTIINNYSEFSQTFGGKNPELKIPYLADEYLRNAGSLTVVRVLGGGEFTYSSVGEIQSGSTLLLVIRPTVSASGTYAMDITGSNVLGLVSMSSFDLHLSCSGFEETYTSVSLTPSDSTYIGKIIGTNPKGPGYFYVDHTYSSTVSSSLSDYNGLITTASITSSTSAIITSTGFSHAVSPTIISQTFGSTNHDLFKFHVLTDGTDGNRWIKAGIFNIKPSGSVPGSNYGTFGIAVRQYNDTDANPVVLESFTDCNLDPDSPNFLAKKIGDQYTTTDSNGKITVFGDYSNLSKYIRIEILKTSSIPSDAVPFGFKNYKKYNSTAPDIKYKTSQSFAGDHSTKAYYGIDYENTDVDIYHNPLPTNSANNSSNFLLSNCISYSAGVYSGSISLNSALTEKQFIVGFQNGFDGFDPRKNIEDQRIYTTSALSGSIEFVKGIDSVKNPDEFDFNMLVIPDLNWTDASYVLKYGLRVCEDRGDAFMLMDLGKKTTSRDTIIDNAKSIDSSYAAAYYPWVKIYDDENSKNVWVPPSVVMSGIIAYTDKVSHEWFAPAGLNRGGLTSVLQTYDRLDSTDRDVLYAGRINPIATFPQTGVVAWGQKTLQAKASALDRINVRRLLIKIKKLIASASRYLVFEANSEETWLQFRNIVDPILSQIVANAGLYEYRVVMDETTNTPDLIDRNIMKGAVYLKPTKTAEFIVIDFNIMPTGAIIAG